MLARGLAFTSCTARTLGFSRFQQTQVCERVERELGGTTRRQPTSHALTYACCSALMNGERIGRPLCQRSTIMSVVLFPSLGWSYRGCSEVWMSSMMYTPPGLSSGKR